MTSKFNKLPQKLSVFLFLFACNERIENVKLNNGNWVEKKKHTNENRKRKNGDVLVDDDDNRNLTVVPRSP